MAETLLPSGVYTTNGHHAIQETRQDQLNAWLLTERLTMLELALQNADWRQLSHDGEQEFSREGLRAITDLSRLMFLKNPLIKRGVKVKANYVWGQGMTVRAKDKEINEVLQAFLDDQANLVELTGHQARTMKEQELEVDGNLFLVLFTNKASGRVRVRSIAFSEIDDVIRNPDDNKDPWFYRRTWTEETLDTATGTISMVQKTAYYPDWRYNPTGKPEAITSYPVMWTSPIYHIKIGGFSDWKFGVSEVYTAIDWAKAYKEFLEDWASIVRAYRRFAWELKTPGGKRGIAAAKTKLSTTLSTDVSESNPPPVTGSVFIGGNDTSMRPLSGGPSVSAEDGRRLLLMTAAALGLPETFFGDVSVGTLATAKSLDRPTELAMLDRRTLWEDVHQAIFEYVLLCAAKANKLAGLATVKKDTEDNRIVETLDWAADVDPHTDIDFPPLVTRDPLEEVDAVVKAASTGKLEDRDVTRLLLTALGENDIDEIMGAMYDEDGNRLGPDGEVVQDTEPDAPGQMAEAVRELREALVMFKEKYEA